MESTSGNMRRPTRRPTFRVVASCILATAMSAMSLTGCGTAGTTNTGHDDVLQVTEQDFRKIVLQAEQPVLVDFWADWCGPCHLLAPIVQEYAAEAKDSAVIAKVDVDANVSLAEQYQVNELPTLVVFYRGKEVDRIVGLVDQGEIREVMSRWIDRPAESDLMTGPSD